MKVRRYLSLVVALGLASGAPAMAQSLMVESSTLDDLQCEKPPAKLTEQQRFYWFEAKGDRRSAAVTRASNEVLLQGGVEAAASRAARDQADKFEFGDMKCADLEAAAIAKRTSAPRHSRQPKN